MSNVRSDFDKAALKPRNNLYELSLLKAVMLCWFGLNHMNADSRRCFACQVFPIHIEPARNRKPALGLVYMVSGTRDNPSARDNFAERLYGVVSCNSCPL